jgi:hydrogenase maturation protease
LIKTLILGLGNPLLRDDSVGLRVIQELQDRLAARPGIEVSEDYWGGLRLMERMIGFDRVIVVDAMRSGGAPGVVRRLSPDSVPTQRSASSHDVNLPTALQLGRMAGAQLPSDDRIVLIGIEAADVETFSEQLTPEVLGAIPEAVKLVLSELESD